MKINLLVFLIFFSLCFAQEEVTIKCEIGHIVDFENKSENIFHDLKILGGEETGKLTEKRDNSFYEKYSYNKMYADFYDFTKKSIWNVLGNGDDSCQYRPIPYKIKASSTLENNQIYSANNLYDNSFKTVWSEGNKGYGVNEYFEYYLNNKKLYDINNQNNGFTENNGKMTIINEVRLFNGYVKSKKLYKENSRIKKIKMYVDNKPWAVLEVADTTSQQIFKIPEINYLKIKNTNNYDADLIIKFEIKEVYPGEKYKDTCLTELLLYTYDGQ